MIATRITFQPEHGMEVLYLGKIAVGRVAPDGGRAGRPRWLFNLKGAAAFWKDERTVEAAKAALIAALDDWLDRAGLA